MKKVKNAKGMKKATQIKGNGMRANKATKWSMKSDNGKRLMDRKF